MSKLVGIYGRVSTTGGSCEMQQRDLRQMAERRELPIYQEYFDTGVSGTKASRPALDTMLNDAKHGKFQVLLVWRLDRLGRSLSHLLRIMETLQACHVDLVSYSEGLDFSTASGKLMYQLLAAFSEFERNTICERVRCGLRNARAKGKRIGRPGADASLISKAREMVASGHSLRSVGKSLGLSVATVHKYALSGRWIPSAKDFE